MKTKKLKCRKGRINNTQFQGDVFVKTAIRIESSKRLRLKREKWSLLIAKERGVRVPEVIEYYVDKNGREVLKLKKIDAQILLHFPVSRQVEIMRRVGTEMLKLKSISKNFGWPHPETMKGEYKSWNLFLYDFVKTYGGKLTNHYIIDEKIVSNLLQELKQFDFNIQNSDLIHRDIKPNNILCSKDLSNFWIIDWENTLLGDQLFDIAVFGANYGHNRLWRGLIDGFDKPSIQSKKYKLYEMISLIGTIDFYREHQMSYFKNTKTLRNLAKELRLDV